MKTIKIAFSIIALLIASNTFATTVTYVSEEITAGGPPITYNNSLVGIVTEYGSDVIEAIPQFDPSLGTLTAFNITFSGFLDYSILNHTNNPTTTIPYITNPSLPHDFSAQIQFGAGIIIHYSGSDHLRVIAGWIKTVSCNGTGPLVCPASEVSAGSFYISETLTDAELSSFIGTENLTDGGGIYPSLYAGLDSISYSNLEFPFVDLELSLESSEATVEYVYSPVPLSAAAWFFISGLAALLIPMSRRKSL